MKISDFEHLPSKPGSKRGNAQLTSPLRVINVSSWKLDTIITFNIGGEQDGKVQTADRAWHDPERFHPAPTIEQAQTLLKEMIDELVAK